jgi:hypothetical protein
MLSVNSLRGSIAMSDVTNVLWRAVLQSFPATQLLQIAGASFSHHSEFSEFWRHDWSTCRRRSLRFDRTALSVRPVLFTASAVDSIVTI